MVGAVLTALLAVLLPFKLNLCHLLTDSLGHFHGFSHPGSRVADRET